MVNIYLFCEGYIILPLTSKKEDTIKIENNEIKGNIDSSSFLPGNNNYNDNNKFKYTKITIDNPYNNRKLILKLTKKQKGVYV